MADAEVTRWNERSKAIAGTFFQLGSALLAAGVVKTYVDRGIGWEASLWSFAGGALIWVGWKWLGLLGPED